MMTINLWDNASVGTLNMLSYRAKIQKILNSPERRLFRRLRSPAQIQDYLDSLPINFELSGESYMSPRQVIRQKTAHCFEAAVFAAAALACNGHRPLLLDLKAVHGEDDHVIAPFRVHGYWGAISKSNHAVLRYRDAVYRTVRELAMSYFHEYTAENGRKVMRSYSTPLDLARYAIDEWFVAETDLVWLVNALDAARHIPVAAGSSFRSLRRATRFELDTLEPVEWPRSDRIKKISSRRR